MGIIIKLKDANFSYAGLQTYVEKLLGFTADNLQNLYLFDDADPKTLSTDKKGLYNTAPSTGVSTGSAKSNLTGGGGINLTKNGYVQGSTVDATLPYTIMWSGIMGVPSSGIQPILGFKEFYQYGFQLYASASSGQAAGTLFGINARQAKLGLQDGSESGTHYKGLVNYKIGMNATFFCVYNGTGQLQWYIYDGATLLDTDTAYLPIDETNYTTNNTATVNKMLTPVVGTGNAEDTFNGANNSIDAFAVYTKPLSAGEMVVNAMQGKTLMTARGR